MLYMSKKDNGLYIVDIFIASSKLQRYTSGFTNAQELLHDEVYWDATIRELQIVGEASNKLIKNAVIDDTYQDIVDFRNLITHAYFGINAQMVWDILKEDLQHFIEELFIFIKNNNINLFPAIECAKQEQLTLRNKKTVSYLDDLQKKLKTS